MVLAGFCFDRYSVKQMRTLSKNKIARIHDFIVESHNKKLRSLLDEPNSETQRERIREITQSMVDQLVRTKALPAGLRAHVVGGEKVLHLTSNKTIVNVFRLDERERAEAAADAMRELYKTHAENKRAEYEPTISEVDLRDQVSIVWKIAPGTPTSDVEKLLPILNGRIKLIDV